MWTVLELREAVALPRDREGPAERRVDEEDEAGRGDEEGEWVRERPAGRPKERVLETTGKVMAILMCIVFSEPEHIEFARKTFFLVLRAVSLIFSL